MDAHKHQQHTAPWTFCRENTDVHGAAVMPMYLILEDDELVAEVYTEDAARLIVEAVNEKLQDRRFHAAE
jgi:hypothetical protein